MRTVSQAWRDRSWNVPVIDAAPYKRNNELWTVAFLTLDNGLARAECVAYANTPDEKIAYDAMYAYMLRRRPELASFPIWEYGTRHDIARPYNANEVFRIMRFVIVKGQT